MELTKEAKSAERRPGESELDFYERRYKERVTKLFKNILTYYDRLIIRFFDFLR